MTPTPEPDVRELAMAAIRSACPGDDECLADEEECFRAHPIHIASMRNGVIEQVYADVAGLADAVLAAVTPVIRRQALEEFVETAETCAVNERLNVHRYPIDSEMRKIGVGALRAYEWIVRLLRDDIAHSTQPTEEETTR